MPDDHDHRALSLFAEHVTQQGDGAAASIEELCREHPDLAPRLRTLARDRAEALEHAPSAWRGEHRARSKRARSARASTALDSAQLTELDAGRSASRYVLLGELARGGMGIVFQVWDRVLRRPLAMKMLDVDAESDGEDGLRAAGARFLEEARVAGQLEHPGVVPIHDLGIDESGRLYFTMPLIEGRDLEEAFDRARAKTEGWSLTRALLALTKVCEVVAYAHARGILHRDLKPANVMVGKFGETYVMDWGLAKVVGRPEREPATADDAEPETTDDGRTMDGTVFGTPAYMAPEQADGRVADVSFQTDVYALGAMLYRLLAGRKPYAARRGQSDAASTLTLVRRGPPSPLARTAPDAPRQLAAICERAMARRPEDRYASVEAFALDLQAFLEGRVVLAYEGGFMAGLKKRRLRHRAQRCARASAKVVARAGASMEQYERALERARDASKLAPEDPALRALVGAALVRAGEPASGIEVLERALDALDAPDRARAQAFLGLAHCALGASESAARARDALRASARSGGGGGSVAGGDVAGLLRELEQRLEILS